MQVSAVSQLFAADAGGAVQALAEVVQQGVVLPGARMNDGWHQQGNPTQLPRSSSSMQGAEQPMQDQQQQQPGQQADSAGSTVDGSIADARCCSQLYVDFMAAADALGIWTVNDVAAAVEQCCKVWQVRHEDDNSLRLEHDSLQEVWFTTSQLLLDVAGTSFLSKKDKQRRQVFQLLPLVLLLLMYI
jgi:hypothetical protein